MSKQEGVPTVLFSSLCDGHNFKDQTFKSFVDAWMTRNMPSSPMGLLDTTSPERWERQAKEKHSVKEIEFVDTDGDEWVGYIVLDEYGEAISESTEYADYADLGSTDRTLVHEGVEGVYCWDEQSDAEDAARGLDEAFGQENETFYGFPWAHSWFHIPENFITDEQLKAAGFVVATYTGGAGTPADEEFRICGIDGGGYGFAEAHYAPLVARYAEDREITVETDAGYVYVTLDERPDLEKLAEAGR